MIQIDYAVLAYIVIGLFALVGFTRGWLREAFTTILLMVLVFMLAQPKLAAAIIEALGKIIIAFLSALTRRAPQAGAINSIIEKIRGIFNIENPYGFLILLAAFLVFISYTVGKRALDEGRLSPLSRILGGTMGAINGFIIVSLLREYIISALGLTIPAGDIRASDAMRPLETSKQVTVSVQNMPTGGITSGYTMWLLLALGLVVLFFFVRDVRLHAKPKK